eukprot:1929797-Prymnesium_polylepis.2
MSIPVVWICHKEWGGARDGMQRIAKLGWSPESTPDRKRRSLNHTPRCFDEDHLLVVLIEEDHPVAPAAKAVGKHECSDLLIAFTSDQSPCVDKCIVSWLRRPTDVQQKRVDVPTLSGVVNRNHVRIGENVQHLAVGAALVCPQRGEDTVETGGEA